MKKKFVKFRDTLLQRLQERYGYQQIKVYGIFPAGIKTTFRRDA